MRAAAAVFAFLFIGEADTPSDPVDKMLQEDYSCDRASAKPVNIEALTLHPARYINECIRSRGELEGRWFVKNLRQIEAMTVEELAEKQAEIIGVEFHPPEKHGSEPDQSTLIDIVGRVRSCSERSEVIYRQQEAKALAAGDNRPLPPPMLTGACHYMNVVVYVSDWHVVRALK